MHSQPKPRNPWTKNVQQKRNVKASKNSISKPLTSSELKFKEAQSKLQAAVKKHVKEYESSSDEEELDSGNLIDTILKSYKNTGGDYEFIGRTSSFIEETLLSAGTTCLICISRVRRDDEIWSCGSCYGFFHLMCIQRWSKDTITQQKHAFEQQIVVHQKNLCWCCPKCRFEYTSSDVPSKYLCFCKKTESPKYQPFLVPHSCGEICKKELVPKCGHMCMLLCHPGPCPPCPVTVNVSCYCGNEPPRTQRCSSKEWSCSGICGKPLKCDKHSCNDPCHPGECKPCPKKSVQRCVCKSQQKLRDCAEPLWHCDKVCNKALECGNHRCQEVCHDGVCDMCPLSKLRTCPCGKTTFQLPCTEDTPSCQDTCEKLLECGVHTCNQRCHKEKCGQCLETVEKYCRCGLHIKEIQCFKPYFCEVKCKQMKDCNKHPCNRKCCDGNCPPCEKPCGRTLNCGNHKCTSVCHRGPCYPCSQTDFVTCRCGETKLVVPCGRKNKTRPPKCTKLCLFPPDCHHKQRENHKCHFGDCPPCKQTCNKSRTSCCHLCPSPCHSAVLMKIEGQKASMPWEQTKPQFEKKELPCPDCVVPVAVTCLGEHETSDWPCYLAKPSSCHRPCGRKLECGNHSCSLPCHLVEETINTELGINCEKCEGSCSKERPEGCPHSCPRPCHPGPCPPCKNMVRIKCYCGLHQPYVTCSDWLNEDKHVELQSCGNQCPKNYECGHRCKANCHSGPCPNPEGCKKKVKITCKCKRLKKEFSCETVRKKLALIDCDDVCFSKKEEERKIREAADEQRKKEEEMRQRKELEKYQKMFEGKKKSREKRKYNDDEEVGLVKKYWFIIISVALLVLSLVVYFIYK
nr:NF-X1-type zinc finger protein NFXL1 [Leptinotarsa decemlineata]